VNKKDIDPTNVQIRTMREEEVDAMAVLGRKYFGAPRPECYQERLGSATRGAGINTSFVAAARTSISQVGCKG
jgi:hypothetical protein